MGIEPLTQTYSTTILQKMVRSPQEDDVWSVTGPEDPRAWRKVIDSPLLGITEAQQLHLKRICLKYIIKPRKKEAKKGEELKMWPPYLCVSAERLHQFWI